MKNNVNPEIIVNYICNFYDTKPAYVFKKTRVAEIILIRQTIQYLLLKYTGLNKGQIGKISLLYGRIKPHDHATILHSSKTVLDRYDSEPSFKKELDVIEKVLNEFSEVKSDAEAFSIFDSISKVKELEHEVVQLKAQLIDIKRKTSELMTLVA